MVLPSFWNKMHICVLQYLETLLEVESMRFGCSEEEWDEEEEDDEDDEEW